MPYAHDVTRRTLLRSAALGSIALASGTEHVFGQTALKPPNVIFIMADDLGYADVACYGRPDLSTPNIDGVAANGVRFLQAYQLCRLFGYAHSIDHWSLPVSVAAGVGRTAG
jgi:hypothetical protein